jgi:N-methylhydantoinase B
MAIDQVTTEVINHRFIATVDEMMATLVKTSYSPNIKERRDCSVAAFDARGDLIALNAIGPIHLGSLLGMVQNLTQRFPLGTLKPGDAFLTNDPYVGGGSHLPDLTITSPVFADGNLVAFVSSLAHHSDIGGKAAGSESADCTSIFQEGLRIPPVKFLDQGRLCQDIFDIVLLNSRTPRERDGDLKAQLASNAIGIRRVTETYSRFGTDTVLAGIKALLDYSEARTRAEIAKLPDGTYKNEDFLDSDGINEDLIPLKVAITICGNRIHFDFTGVAPQVGGARNMPMIATLACVYYAVKVIADPTLPPNAGYFRAIDVTIPPNTVLNSSPPAAVGDRVATANIVGDLLIGAFAKVVPDRVMAGCGPLRGLIFSGIDPRRNEFFVDYETYAGASGALLDQDGKDAIRVHVSGSGNLPIESVEQEFPLTVGLYELIQDSGGPGKFRGGLATRRDVTNWAEQARISGRGLREVRGSPGLFGGEPGRTGRFYLHPATDRETKLSGSFSELSVAVGETIRVETPSGAGYGNSLQRDSDRVLADVIAGKVTVEGACRDYGVVIFDGNVNVERTIAKRREMSERRGDHGC